LVEAGTALTAPFVEDVEPDAWAAGASDEAAAVPMVVNSTGGGVVLSGRAGDDVTSGRAGDEVTSGRAVPCCVVGVASG
jgi:hypothetical protein